MNLNSYIAKQFSNPMGFGGKIISFVMNRQNRHLYEETIRLLALSNDDSLLDVGCGNGYVLSMIARESNCILAGIDPSASIIKAAFKRCHKATESGRMTLLCQNIDEMSFADNSFSKGYTINTVYFWDNLNNAMSEIKRVLKPNGTFINTFYSNEMLSHFSHTQFGYKRFTLEQLTKAGYDAGFDVNIIPILNGTAYCAMYHKRST